MVRGNQALRSTQVREDADTASENAEPRNKNFFENFLADCVINVIFETGSL